MTDRFDLEQKIMNAWQVVEDINLLMRRHCDHGMTEDEIQNLLLGLASLYALRFNELFETFEEMVHQGVIK